MTAAVPKDDAAAHPRANLTGNVLWGWLLLALASVFASWAVFRQFGGYDLSPLVDLFWRMRNGAVPGADFINTWPPLLLLVAKACAPFDLGWYELTAANIVVACAAFAALTALTPPAERTVALCTGLAMAVSVPLVYTNHIWHSSLSQYCAAAFFVAFFRSFDRRAWNRRRAASLFITAAVLALSKQNVALPFLAAGLAFAVVFGGALRRTLLVTIVGGALAGILLAVVLLPMSPASFLYSYVAVAGRGLPSHEMLESFRDGATNLPTIELCLAAIAVMVLVIVPAGRLPVRQRLIAALFVAASLIPIVTDWDAKLNNATLPLVIALVTIVAGTHRSGSRVKTGMAQVLLAGVLLVAVFGGASRERMASVGPGAFWEPVAAHRIDHGYFNGLHSGRILADVLQELDEIAATRRQGRFFFGPRMEFGYAELRVPSPTGLPLWWHPGSSYAPADEPRIISAFAANDIDTLVFLGDDRTRMPAGLLAYISRHYRLTAHRGSLQVFDRVKQAHPLHATLHQAREPSADRFQPMSGPRTS